MNEQNNTLPVKKFQAGGIAAAIWENSIKLKNGQQINSLSVTIDRTYKDKNDNWQHSGSFRVNDIGKVQLVIMLGLSNEIGSRELLE